MDHEVSDPAAMQRTFSYLGKYACTLSHLSRLLSAYFNTTKKYVSEMLNKLARKWICSLKTELGYGFDQKDEFGQTPLMSHLSAKGNISLAIVRLLLRSGVNIHATDDYGRNVLQIVMLSALDKKSFKFLKKRLHFLLNLELIFTTETIPDSHYHLTLDIIVIVGLSGAGH